MSLDLAVDNPVEKGPEFWKRNSEEVIAVVTNDDGEYKSSSDALDDQNSVSSSKDLEEQINILLDDSQPTLNSNPCYQLYKESPNHESDGDKESNITCQSLWSKKELEEMTKKNQVHNQVSQEDIKSQNISSTGSSSLRKNGRNTRRSRKTTKSEMGQCNGCHMWPYQVAIVNPPFAVPWGVFNFYPTTMPAYNVTWPPMPYNLCNKQNK